MSGTKLRPIFVSFLPNFEQIDDGEIWISHEHRTVNLRCPFGCGELTVLSIHPSRWHVLYDGENVSLCGPTGGSVWARSCCGEHYWIRRGTVIRAGAIDPKRHAEYEDREKRRMVPAESGVRSPGSWLRRTLRRRPRRRLRD